VLLLGALGTACGPVTTTLPQDVFDADGVEARVPPPPGFRRLVRGEGRSRGSAYTTLAVFGAAGADEGPLGPHAFVLLPSHLGRNTERHRERFVLIRDSWRAREDQQPSAIEREARLRLAAFDRGHADSAAWLPSGESRTLMLGVPLASDDAVVQLSADMPDSLGASLMWSAEAFVLVRGRVLQLQVAQPAGAGIGQLASARATLLAWIAAVRDAGHRPVSPRRRFGRS
jgi:hypothetical protein